MSHLLIIRGDTKPAKEVLKKTGWKWNPDKGYWWMRLVTAHAERVLAGDESFMKDSLKMNRKGCQVTLDGVVVWTSKTFGEATETPKPTHHHDEHTVDSRGYNVRTQKIDGSAPDDRV